MKLKEIINDVEFYIDTKKETFTLGDVLEMQKQWKTKFTGAVSAHVNEELKNINENNSTHSKTIEELTKERDEYKANYEKLNSEYSPIKENMRKTSATNLLKGKVNTGAELAVFEKIEEQLPEDFASLEESKLEELLNNVFETSPYFKPVVVQPESESSDTVAKKLKEEEKEKPIEFVNHNNFGYGG